MLREQGTPVKIRDGPAAVSHQLAQCKRVETPSTEASLFLPRRNEKTRVPQMVTSQKTYQRAMDADSPGLG